jgi:hypothetical protein
LVAGDKDQTVYRDEFNPLSWPEVELVRTIHGDDAVLEVKPFVHINQTWRDERARLVLKYGREYVEACFPGRGANIQTDAPEAEISHGKIWKNPLTQLEEQIEPEPVAIDFSKVDTKGKGKEARI